MKTPAFSYLRVSGRGQIDGDGFRRQAETITRYAKANRIEIVQQFRDEGVSGTKEALDRPGLTDLFVALKANGVRLVIVENATRIARDLMVSEIILAEFRALGVKVVSADGGVDLTLGNDDPTGKLVRQILSAVSEWEKCLIVQKLRASRLRIRRAGGRCEGRKAYGSTPAEQAVIERIQAWREQGKSYAEIAGLLNAEHVLTRSGEGSWHPTQLQRIVRRVQASLQRRKTGRQ
ncbi:MAG TPA: recombinase family protein [Verrucomicrobiota bacterium]|nr:recombinase family protein [Verrucomicrobiota bacterium]